MQIVDRYLRSVKNCLPAGHADDIIKELSENISSQIEDKESQLNRSLTEPEIEAILKQHGHPLVVASRYRNEQRSVSDLRFEFEADCNIYVFRNRLAVPHRRFVAVLLYGSYRRWA